MRYKTILLTDLLTQRHNEALSESTTTTTTTKTQKEQNYEILSLTYIK